MRVPKTWVSLISKKIVEGITSKQLITSQVPIEKLLADVEEIITAELMVEDRLNDEIREILKKYNPEIENSRLDYRKLFDLTKRKLVKERNVIL
jgi:hypothetical protein